MKTKSSSINIHVVEQQHVCVAGLHSRHAVIPVCPQPRPPPQPTLAHRRIPLRARRVVVKRVVTRPIGQVPATPPADALVAHHERSRQPLEALPALRRVLPIATHLVDNPNHRVALRVKPREVVPQARQPNIILHQAVRNHRLTIPLEPKPQVEAPHTEHIILRCNRHTLALRHPRQRTQPPTLRPVVRPTIVRTYYHICVNC